MKRILHVSKFYYPYYGGIEDVAHTLVEQLKPCYEQKVICFNHGSATISEMVDGVEVLRVGVSFSLASQPITMKYFKLLQKLVYDFKPDFIHVHLPNPLVCLYILLLNLSGAKIIAHWHADILGKQFLYCVCKPIEKKILKRASVILATSPMYVEYSAPLRGFFDKIRILPNTIDEKKFLMYPSDYLKVDSIRKIYDYKKIVFFVGRHVPYKGIKYLIECTQYLDENAVVVIAGTGEQMSDLKAMAAKNNRIFFLGRLSDEDVKLYMYAASVFAFPSIDRREAFGVALAEALYCGLPAVSFQINGSGVQWVNQDEKTGFVVHNFNACDFADAINKILRSSDLRDYLSRNARSWVDMNFRVDKIRNTLQEIYI